MQANTLLTNQELLLNDKESQKIYIKSAQKVIQIAEIRITNYTTLRNIQKYSRSRQSLLEQAAFSKQLTPGHFHHIP